MLYGEGSSTGHFHDLVRKGGMETMTDIDQLGLGVSMYFKIIKSLIMLLVIATLLSLPYLNVYMSGDQASTASGTDKTLGVYSLGNIGQSLEKCISQDIMACNTISILCPDHSIIKELK